MKPAHYYVQSAVAPFRLLGGRAEEELELLLITSRKKKRWVLPKGVCEPGMTAQDSAAKEALEEAGIEGPVLEEALGTYRYRKWGGVCTVEVFAMRVDLEHEEWEESFRDREWLSLAAAIERIEEPGLRRILGSLPEALGGTAGQRTAAHPGDVD